MQEQQTTRGVQGGRGWGGTRRQLLLKGQGWSIIKYLSTVNRNGQIEYVRGAHAHATTSRSVSLSSLFATSAMGSSALAANISMRLSGYKAKCLSAPIACAMAFASPVINTSTKRGIHPAVPSLGKLASFTDNLLTANAALNLVSSSGDTKHWRRPGGKDM